MCGIIGLASKQVINNIHWVESGCEQLNHRGPDGSGLWKSSNEQVVFGHKRLSIIDLSQKGSQPMRDNNNNVITFNGEIYNYLDLKKFLVGKGYVFCSSTDTEVILAAYSFWGLDFLNRLDGMFAFAIYDFKKEIVLLARDRFGQKPLYYHLTENKISFASEMKAMLMDPEISRTIDEVSLKNFMCFGFLKGNKSLIKNIQKLEPGSVMVFDLKKKEKVKSHKFANISIVNRTQKTYAEIINNLDYIIKESVKKHLIADVPICILLSGGLDSSLVTAYASQICNSINTFHISFIGEGIKNESSHASLIAKHYQTQHNEIKIDLSSDLDFEKIINNLDEPIADTSIISTYLVSKEISTKYKVALGGDGGDEIFGGYNKYQYFQIFKKIQKFFPKKILSYFSNLAPFNKKNIFKSRNIFSILANNLLFDLFHYQYFSNNISSLFRDNKFSELIDGALLDNYKLNKGNLVNSFIFDDLINFLPNNILHKIDSCSMANSLEIRSPFLSNDITDYVTNNISFKDQVTMFDKKILLKKLAKNILPNNFSYNRKQGFSIPINLWLKKNKNLSKNIFETLMSSRIFSQNEIIKLSNEFHNNYLHGDKIFLLYVLELWFNKNKINF